MCWLGVMLKGTNLFLSEPIYSILPGQLAWSGICWFCPKESFDLHIGQRQGVTVFPCPSIPGNCLDRIGIRTAPQLTVADTYSRD